MDLENKIRLYYDADTKQKQWKKERDVLNEQVKSEMISQDLKKTEVDNLEVVCSKVEKTKVNEEKMVRLLEEGGFEEALETKKIPNQEVIEQLINDGKLDPQILSDCVEDASYYALKIKKKKEKK